MNGKTGVCLCLTTVLMYCTTGVDSVTVDPHSVSGVCEQQKIIGNCNAAFQRWYYNSRINQCIQFVYGGCGGNSNNFQTKQDCTDMCKRQSVCDLPKKIDPCRASIPRWFYDKVTETCKKFYWGGCQENGNNFETFSQCSKQCTCHLPKKIGPCKAAFRRYYYKDASCKVFFWGGCKPNGNNFKTWRACRKTCMP